MVMNTCMSVLGDWTMSQREIEIERQKERRIREREREREWCV